MDGSHRVVGQLGMPFGCQQACWCSGNRPLEEAGEPGGAQAADAHHGDDATPYPSGMRSCSGAGARSS